MTRTVDLEAFGREMRARFEAQGLTDDDARRLRTPDTCRTDSKRRLLQSVRDEREKHGQPPW